MQTKWGAERLITLLMELVLGLLVGTLFVLALPTPAQAQQGTASAPAQNQKGATPATPKEPTAKPQGNADAPEDDATLYLTTDQKARIKAIRDDAELQIQAAGKDATLTPEQKERKVKQIRKATRAAVFAVLTPDQQKTWSAEQREKRENKTPPKPH